VLHRGSADSQPTDTQKESEKIEWKRNKVERGGTAFSQIGKIADMDFDESSGETRLAVLQRELVCAVLKSEITQ